LSCLAIFVTGAGREVASFRGLVPGEVGDGWGSC
jgi:hypothetical protein